MNDAIDSGDIISRVKIPYTDDLDISLLYQLSFIAEKQAFTAALHQNFIPNFRQEEGDFVYFSRKTEDRILLKSDSIDTWLRKIKAFANRNQGCLMEIGGVDYCFHQMELLNNPFLAAYAANFDNGVIVLSYENSVIFKKEDCLILLRSFSKENIEVAVNSKAFS
jgi:methionyl-tRNA formyltransferase